MKSEPADVRVSILMDAASEHWRGVFAGAMEYAKNKKAWRLFVDLRTRFDPNPMWPASEGVIIAASTQALAAYARKLKSWVVNVSGRIDTPGLTCVRADSESPSRLAIEHFRERGFEHFAFYGDSELFVSRRRLTGFKKALKQPCEQLYSFDCLKKGPASAENSKWSIPINKWLQSLPKPIGLFVYNDFDARAIADCCQKLGYAIPEQIALLGVDNDSLYCDAVTPPLSSIQQNSRRIGYLAAQTLDKMMSGSRQSSKPVEVAALDVVTRQSTDIVAVKDPDLVMAIKLIRTHACDGLSVKELVQHLPVTRRWLERKFSEVFKRSPHDEIIRIRMRRAENLLRTTDLPATTVSKQVGYASVQSFGAVFKSTFGVRPRKYRQSFRVAQ